MVTEVPGMAITLSIPQHFTSFHPWRSDNSVVYPERVEGPPAVGEVPMMRSM